MNGKEKRFLLIGIGVGLVLAVSLVGAITTAHKGYEGAAAKAAMTMDPEKSAAATSNESEITPIPGASVELTDTEQKAAGVQVAEVKRQMLVNRIDAFGRVEEPEAQLRTISARVGGRIDRLYVQFTGQTIRAGQPIADVYSPDVAATAEEYRLAVENRRRLSSGGEAQAVEQAEDLVAASRRRLELWGISNQQVDRLLSGDPKLNVTIYAPFGGTITERKATTGQYVNTGDTLYTVADLNEVWVKAEVYEADLSQIRMGQAVDITTDSLANQTIHGRTEFIEPSANPQTRTVAVHVHVPNPGMRLRPGMYVRANFAASNADLLVIPRSAVLDSGTRKLVYIANGNGAFTARQVELGPPTSDLYPVVSGLKQGEFVVTNGNFLIDSQTRLSGGMSSLYGGSKEYAAKGEPKAAMSATAAAQAYKMTFKMPATVKGAAANSFQATLVDASGNSIADAKVHVTLVMPAMPSMGMSEMRSTGDLKWTGKDYAAEVNVPMGGSWNTTIEATRNGQTVATQHVRISAE